MKNRQSSHTLAHTSKLIHSSVNPYRSKRGRIPSLELQKSNLVDIVSCRDLQMMPTPSILKTAEPSPANIFTIQTYNTGLPYNVCTVDIEFILKTSKPPDTPAQYCKQSWHCGQCSYECSHNAVISQNCKGL